MYSCGQMLSPRTIINEFKTELKGKPELKDMPKQGKVSPARNYRRVPMDRLITRLGIKKYDVPSPITDKEIDAKKVKIMLSQHIGAPATPVVKEGDSVVKGQVVASTKDKLGADIHASIDGKVGEITKTYIKIERTN
jgi:biotin carboxyl carrier protein